MSAPLEFIYRNHRGEVRGRRVYPHSVAWRKTEWHDEGWIMQAYDDEKGELRDFAMKDILGPPPSEEDFPAWEVGSVPSTVSREELIGLLEGLIALVRADDSMEGTIQYSWGDEPGQYKVGGIVRVGNQMGQGGVRLLWQV